MVAGPAILVSYIITSIVAFINAVCTIEMVCVVGKSSLNYQLMYITMGELAGATIGWVKVCGRSDTGGCWELAFIL